MKFIHKLLEISEPRQCLWAMGILNFSIICYVASIQAFTQKRAALQGAQSFFYSLNTTPISPAIRIYIVFVCYFLICACIFLKNRYQDPSPNGFILLNIYEILLVMVLLVSLDLSYNGIIFFIVAELLQYAGSRKNWIFFMFFAFLLYIIFNYNMVSLFFSLNSFDSWASYYDSFAKSYILGIKTMCEVLNIMLFLLYIALMTQQDQEEKRIVKGLNRQLSDLNFELKKANHQLHQFALEKEQIGEMKERNRLAREIHDTIGHGLTGISVGLEAVEVLMDLSPDMAKSQLHAVSKMARSSLDDVRRSVRKLKPDSLESKSFDLAIHEMIDEMSKTTGTQIYFVSYGEHKSYREDVKETIYRLVQEGMTNAIRHGRAKEIWIRLDRNEKQVEVFLKDDGLGCDSIKEGFGLTHMRERVEMLGGDISFSSKEGFEIHASIPIGEKGREEIC